MTEPQKNRWERISDRAFEIYEARGGQDGRHLDDWLEAERQVDAEDDLPRPAANVPEDRAEDPEHTNEAPERVSPVLPRRGGKRQTRSAAV